MRGIVFLVLLVGLLILSAPTQVTPQWVIERVDITGDVGLYTSIGLDRNNFPHISYYDARNGNLKYAHWEGSTWAIEMVDSLGDVGQCTSLALDSLDHPHIAYHDYTNRDLKYVVGDGAGWAIEIVDTANVSISQWISLVLDPTGYPHISYRGDNRLRYARWDGATWHTETVDTTNWSGKGNSIDLDPTDNHYPCISYADMRSDLKFAHWDGLTWHSEWVDSNAAYTSLTIDPSGVARIAYRKILSYDVLLGHAWKTGSVWQVERVLYPATNYGAFSSIAIDISGNPRISCFCEIDGDLLYARKNGTWSVDRVDYMGRVGLYTSLALKNGVTPCMSYYDETNGDLKYACQLTGVEETQLARNPRQEARLFQNFPNPFTAVTSVQFSLRPEASGPRAVPSGFGDQHVTLRVYDISGRLIRTLFDELLATDHHRGSGTPPRRGLPLTTAVSWDGKNETGREVSAGVYFCRLLACNSVLVKKMVLMR